MLRDRQIHTLYKSAIQFTAAAMPNRGRFFLFFLIVLSHAEVGV